MVALVEQMRPCRERWGTGGPRSALLSGTQQMFPGEKKCPAESYQGFFLSQLPVSAQYPLRNKVFSAMVKSEMAEKSEWARH